jgi:hypothetical protein
MQVFGWAIREWGMDPIVVSDPEQIAVRNQMSKAQNLWRLSIYVDLSNRSGSIKRYEE